MITRCFSCDIEIEIEASMTPICPECFRYSRLNDDQKFLAGPPRFYTGISPRDAEGNINTEFERVIEGNTYAGNLPEHEEFSGPFEKPTPAELKKAWNTLKRLQEKKTKHTVKQGLGSVSEIFQNQVINLKEYLERKYHVA